MRAAVARSGGAGHCCRAARARRRSRGDRRLGPRGRPGPGAGAGSTRPRELWESWDEFYRSGRWRGSVRAAQLTCVMPHVFSHDSARRCVQRMPLLHPHRRRRSHHSRGHAGRRGPSAGVRPSRRAVRRRPRARDVDGLTVLDIPRTVADLAREHGYRAGLVAADGAMQLGVSRAELRGRGIRDGGVAVQPHGERRGRGCRPRCRVRPRDVGARAGGRRRASGTAETQFPVQIPSGIGVGRPARRSPPDRGGRADQVATDRGRWAGRPRPGAAAVGGAPTPARGLRGRLRHDAADLRRPLGRRPGARDRRDCWPSTPSPSRRFGSELTPGAGRVRCPDARAALQGGRLRSGRLTG